MSNTVTIVIDGGLVQSVYATDSTMRVIVLDLDIGAPTLTPAHLYGPRRGARARHRGLSSHAARREEDA